MADAATIPLKTQKIKMTERRMRILQSAAAHKIGLVSRPYMTGFERVSWDRNAKYLVDAGLLTVYIYAGEYEITDAGRATLLAVQAKP
jgi:hypothetical protein